MARLRGPASHLSKVCLICEDNKGHNMKGLFFVSETPSSLRLRWLREALESSEEEAKKKKEQCHITMIELLGSLHTIILDGEGETLGCINNPKDKAVLIISWRWEKECDSTLEPELHILILNHLAQRNRKLSKAKPNPIFKEMGFAD